MKRREFITALVATGAFAASEVLAIGEDQISGELTTEEVMEMIESISNASIARDVQILTAVNLTRLHLGLETILIPGNNGSLQEIVPQQQEGQDQSSGA